MTGDRWALLGREAEVAVLRRLVDDARRGRSGVLVVRGEPGVGKTALVDQVVASSAGVRVLRATGVESEMELPFAVLHQLCAPALERLDDLAAPQRDALRIVLGLAEGEPPDPLLVGLGVLSLLAAVAGDEPLVCVVDDAQWMDQASARTVAFVARRLLADPMCLLLLSRGRPSMFADLPYLDLGGVDDATARALLDAAVPPVLDQGVRTRVLAEAGGNPLALLELPRTLGPLPSGRRGSSRVSPVADRIEASFRRRLAALPADTQLLMLVAAAEPVGDPMVVLAAARALGVGPDAVEPAEADGLLDVAARVSFRHPLVRSSAYGAASAEDRGRAHVALAAATDPERDPDRRAWHLAQAATGPDDDLAAELARSAGRAQARGGYAAAAAFLERAAASTVDAKPRARRALDAAQARHLAGAHAEAAELLVAAEAGPLDEAERAEADLLRAEIAYTERRGNDAPGLLLRAAKRLEAVDLRTARDTYLDAVFAAHFAGRLAHGTSLRDTALAARAAPPIEGPPSASDLLLDGVAVALVDGYAAGAHALRRAVAAFRSQDVTTREELRWLWPAAHIAMLLWDDESYEVLARRHIELAREFGMLAIAPTALTTRAVATAYTGRLAVADQLVDEMRVLTDTMGVPLPPYAPVFVAGWRGRKTAEVLDNDEVHDAAARGEGAGLAFAGYARAVLYNGLGRYPEAFAAASSIGPFHEDGFVISTAALVELVEAAARSGEAGAAREAFDTLAEATRVAGTDWAGGVRAWCEALLQGDDAAEGNFRAAVDLLARTRIRPHLGRAHLAYGEWLRRRNRRVDARVQLRLALELFEPMGTEAFAERARRELQATGETVRRRSVETLTDLTAQESQIARLAIEGNTNAEIGAQLFLSPRTVEWHLRNVFTKVGIGSRRELRAALPLLGTDP